VAALSVVPSQYVHLGPNPAAPCRSVQTRGSCTSHPVDHGHPDADDVICEAVVLRSIAPPAVIDGVALEKWSSTAVARLMFLVRADGLLHQLSPVQQSHSAQVAHTSGSLQVL
jgi:hypothetical protein